MGLSDCSSVGSSSVSTISPRTDNKLNLKATELRLGLPGSQSPDRDVELHLCTATEVYNEKPLFPLHPSIENSCVQKTVVAGLKRGFSYAIDVPVKEKFLENGELNGILPSRSSRNMERKSGLTKEGIVSSISTVEEMALSGKSDAINETITNVNARATKAQVVGWPPVRSFRQKILATTLKNNDEVEKKPAFGALLVKVSMDGAPYLRKVDLRNYSTYQELSYALAKMFCYFTLGPCGSNEVSGEEMLNESVLKNVAHRSEYVLTYEDKDGDWMLMGDVPWEIFIDTCRRLRIMKSVDAIGLAPKTPERTGSVNS